MIETEQLTKLFGDRAAVRDLDLRIANGQVVGFLGLNGAGKTTLLRMLAGDLPPSAGRIRIDGVDAAERPRALRRQVGFAPEDPPLYPELTVTEYLSHVARLRGLRGGEARERGRAAMRRLGLEPVQTQRLDTLSHGYRKRVGIAQAIVHAPRLVILDEPISGLDPVQIVEMRRNVRELAEEHTVLVSSHILPEIRETCDRLVVLHRGRLVAEGSEAELAARLEAPDTEADVRGPADALPGLLSALRALPDVRLVTVVGPDPTAGVTVRVAANGDVREALAAAIVSAGFGLRRLDRAGDPLERVFLDVTRDPQQPEGAAS